MLMRGFMVLVAVVAVGCSAADSGSGAEVPGETVGPVVGKVITTHSGLQYVDLVIGTGASPTAGRTVTVHYTGRLADGTKFDSSVDRGKPFSFSIGDGVVIKGWDQGVMSMRVGGKRKLIIPPRLAYGSKGAGNVIPPNATLTFVVKLLSVE